MPYADDAEHLAAIDRWLEIARNTAPEMVWLDEKPDWWRLDVPFLRRKLAAAEQFAGDAGVETDLCREALEGTKEQLRQAQAEAERLRGEVGFIREALDLGRLSTMSDGVVSVDKGHFGLALTHIRRALDGPQP